MSKLYGEDEYQDVMYVIAMRQLDVLYAMLAKLDEKYARQIIDLHEDGGFASPELSYDPEVRIDG